MSTPLAIAVASFVVAALGLPFVLWWWIRRQDQLDREDR